MYLYDQTPNTVMSFRQLYSSTMLPVWDIKISLCHTVASVIQPFSQKSRTPTVAKEFEIGLYDPAESDFDLSCNSWSAGFFGERLYF